MNTGLLLWLATVPVKTDGRRDRADVERRVDRVEQVEDLADRLDVRAAPRSGNAFDTRRFNCDSAAPRPQLTVSQAPISLNDGHARIVDAR